jgi:RHS repeat-associated protein
MPSRYGGGGGNYLQETAWLGDLPVSVTVPQTRGQFYIAPDHLGAPHQITADRGEVEWQWNHDPFGNGDPLGRFTYELRFPGQYFDRATKLHYNYFRDYDPRLGRYIESDPGGLAAGINSYAYVKGNSVSRIDPLGLTDGFSQWIGAIVNAILCPSNNPDDPCPPCKTVSGTVVPLGTIAYRPMDTPPPGTEEHGIVGPHFNIYEANQAPRNSPKPCKCFWQPIGAVAPSGLPGGAIPIEPFAD